MKTSKTSSAAPADPALCRKWTELGSDLRQLDPFACTPAWQLPYAETFTPDYPLLVECDGENLLAFAEYNSPEGVPFLLPIESMWFSGCPLLGPRAVPFLLEFLDAWQMKHRGTAPWIVISGLHKGGIVEEELWTRIRGKYNFHTPKPPYKQRAASLRGGYDRYLSRRSPNLRSKLKKAQRLARERGITFERHIPRTPEEADAVYGRMLDVELRSWKGIDNCGMSEHPSCDFYRRMIRCLSDGSGRARVIFAMCEGRDIGFVFGGMAGAVYRGQQFSYDNEWQRWSIGNLLQAEQVRWLCEEGAVRYDMGMSADPRMAYKQHWAEQSLDFLTLLLEPMPEPLHPAHWHSRPEHS